MILSSAVKYAIHTCVIGTTNKLSDMEKTDGWVFFSMFRYNRSSRYVSHYIEKKTAENKVKKKIWDFHSDDPEGVMSVELGYSPINPRLDPLNDPQFALQAIHEELLLLALLTQEKRVGNCQAHCSLIAKYLWENSTPDIHRIEILAFNFDHCVVVVNRAGDLDDPATWGNALIADSWYLEQGIIYTAAEFIAQALDVRDLIKTEYLAQHKIGLPQRAEILMETDWINLSWGCYAELLPHQHHYPTYSRAPFYPIEYYYEPNNLYTAEIPKNIGNAHTLSADRLIHVNKFKACLKQLDTNEPSESTSTCTL